MKRTLYVTMAIALILVAIAFTGVITVSNKDLAGPNGVMWKAIQDLQNQINNIKLTPGPQGPQGPQGEPGPAGTSNVIVITGDTTESDLIDIPEGYTFDQCQVFASVKEIPFESERNIASITCYVTPRTPNPDGTMNGWWIHCSYREDSGESRNAVANYLIIARK